MHKKNEKLIVTTLSLSGLFLIACGCTIEMHSYKSMVIKNKYNITIEKNEQEKIELKQLTIKANTPLSTNIKDYLQNAEKITNETLNSLKLDTSMVNINEPDSYTYRIKYKGENFDGKILIEENNKKQDDIKLKNISIEKGTALSANINTYIYENLPQDELNNIKLNIKNIDTAKPGEYQYTITYNNKLYTGTIKVYEKQTAIITKT